MIPGWLRAFAVVLTLVATGAASAHTRSESYSHWQLSGTSLTGTITIPLREVMLLYQDGDASIPPRELFRQEIEAKTSVDGAHGACQSSGARPLQAPSGFIRIEIGFDCPGDVPATLRYRALFDAAPGHVHYARLYAGGRELGEVLLTDSSDRWNIADLDTEMSYTFTAFLGIGVGHIAGGIDHIAFLLGLLLIAGSFGRSIVAVTGFTLGHSASLAAAVLGYVSAEGQLVEAFIGFTVALVALEYFLLHRRRVAGFALAGLTAAWATGGIALAAGFLDARSAVAYGGFGIFAAFYLLAANDHGHPESRRATMLLFVATTCFGLVHGFGFAGFLMETGLLGTSLIVPLLGFNVGVEVGQLILVGIAIVVAAVLKNRVPPTLPQAVAGGLCGLGLYWFVGRTLA
jgi:hypothetical protein